MNNDRFEARQRQREYFHHLRLVPGAWTVIRVDGRSFSRFTETRYEKPFDERFSTAMVAAASALVTELEAAYAYTESDEISVLLSPSWDLFDRSLEKVVSLSAGIASAAFTHAGGEPAHFDSRAWVGTGIADVVDYFSWRQADAFRCALNGWCYWTLRNEGASVGVATDALHRATVADKNELLHARGINPNELPLWQRRGIGLWWDSVTRDGWNPLRAEAVQVERRALHVERDLPWRDDYRDLIRRLAQATVAPPSTERTDPVT